MNEELGTETEHDWKNGSGHAIRRTAGPRVVVLNRTRDIVVIIDLCEVPMKGLHCEGRGDCLLLIWNDHRFLSQNFNGRFPSGCLGSVSARPVSLPCDVDFSNVVPSLEGCRLTLRLPKQAQKLEYETDY